ncbi:hypothetical protein LCGC14_2798380, partial [marine sediment metagenome]
TITSIITYTTIETKAEYATTETATETITSNGFTIGVIIIVFITVGLFVRKREKQ